MKRAPLLLVLGTVVASSGCIDNWPKILQNELTLQHEYNDALMKIVDEDTAKFHKEFYFEKIKNAWEALQKRKEIYLKNRLSNKQVFDDFLSDIAREVKRLGLEFNADAWTQAQRLVEARWMADEGKRQQAGQLKATKEFIHEFRFGHSPNYGREVATIDKRLKQQVARIRGVIFQLENQGLETQNLQKIPDADKQIFANLQR